MNIRPIRTAKDYARVLAEIDRAFRADFLEPKTPHGDRFEVLMALVEAYEKTHVAPLPAPDPIEAIRFRIEQGTVSKKELLSIFKTRARLSEIMNRRRHLSLEMIRSLHKKLGIPWSSLMHAYALRKGPTKRRKAA